MSLPTVSFNDPAAPYPGIDEDRFDGMAEMGHVRRGCWVFGLLAEHEDCAGWDRGRIQALYDQVHQAWEEYGYLASRLPPAYRERHICIHHAAVRRAREFGEDHWRQRWSV